MKAKMQTCKQCGIAKPVTEFHLLRKGYDAPQTICKECNRDNALYRLTRRIFRTYGEAAVEKEINRLYAVIDIKLRALRDEKGE